MKRLVDWLLGHKETRQHITTHMIAVVCNNKIVTHTMLDDLRYRHMMGVYFSEQLERHIEACQELLGIDPEDEQLSDIAASIVTHKVSPIEAIERINRVIANDD